MVVEICGRRREGVYGGYSKMRSEVDFGLVFCFSLGQKMGEFV